jgi:M6 family metalloprotease-like protein
VLFSLTQFQRLPTAMAIQISRMALQTALVAAATTVMVLNTQVQQVVQAMEPNPNPYNITLPDGTTFTVHMTGSEDDPMEEDAEGFAVLPSIEGNGDYEYADVDADTGDVKQSGVKLSDPKGHDKMRRRGVGPGIKRSQAAAVAMGLGGPGSKFAPRGHGGAGRVGNGRTGIRGEGDGRGDRLSGNGDGDNAPPTRRLEHIEDYAHWNESVEDFHRRQLAIDWSGTKKNLVIPMMFSDHHDNGVENRWLPTKQQLDVLFNSDTPDATLAPTGSVKQVFTDNSYGKLTMESDVVDWIALDNTEDYYANGNRGFTTTVHQAMRHALDKLEATGFDFSPYDSDGDGLIDAICFLHSGYAAEWGGTAEDGASYLDRIWSHKWALYSFRHPSDASGSGWTSNPNTSSGKKVRVYNYHISPAVYGKYPSNKSVKDKIGRIGVIAHETGHFLGITDLYDKAGDGGNGIGSWGLMANSWGFKNDQYYPPMMSPWTKLTLGWLDPIEISTSGTYDLSPSYYTEEVYTISAGFADNEYLLVEYRKAIGFEKYIGYQQGMDGGGLAIWHIDNKAGYDHQGWPGMTGWPANGKHYRISLLPADGLYDLERNRNRGDAGDLFVPGIVDSLGPSGTSAGSAYPNTDSYQYGKIESTGIDITSISFTQNGAKMAFDISFPVVATEAPTDAPTAAPTKSPTAAPTAAPTEPPTASPTKSPTSAPTVAPTESPTVSSTKSPTSAPTAAPTESPPTVAPTAAPTESPTTAPTSPPTPVQTASPTTHPTPVQTGAPTKPPTLAQTGSPTKSPTPLQTEAPTKPPTEAPTITCVESERLFSLTLDAPDTSDVSWILEDVAKARTRTVSPAYQDIAADAPQHHHEYCLNIDGCYKFLLKDVSVNGQGMSFVATYDGEVVAEGDGSTAVSVNGGDFGSTCRLAQGNRQIDNLGRTGTGKANGIMFDVQANEGWDVVFYRLAALRLNHGTHNAKVYTKNGSYKGYENDAAAWTDIQTLEGLVGNSVVAWQYSNCVHTPVLAETTQAFYVVVTSGGANLEYNTSPAKAGDVWQPLERYTVRAGVACTSSNAFEGCDDPSLVAGYEGYFLAGLLNAWSTFAPTAAPVILDGTKAPTSSPTQAPLTCVGSERLFSLSMDAPVAASNLSWVVDDVAKDRTHIVSPAYADASEPVTYMQQYCLTIDGCYKFLLKDASSDGTGVSFSATYDGEVIAEGDGSAAFSVNGGDFGSTCRLASTDRATGNLGLAGTSKANGIMFDVQAKHDRDVIIFRLTALRLEVGTHSVKVYTKNGGYKGYETDAAEWTDIQTIEGLIGNAATGMVWQSQNFDIFTPVLAETTQAFYVVVTSGGANLEYNDSPADAGDLWQSTTQYNVLAGVACTSSTEFTGCEDASLVAGYEGFTSSGVVNVYTSARN